MEVNLMYLLGLVGVLLILISLSLKMLSDIKDMERHFDVMSEIRYSEKALTAKAERDKCISVFTKYFGIHLHKQGLGGILDKCEREIKTMSIKFDDEGDV